MAPTDDGCGKGDIPLLTGDGVRRGGYTLSQKKKNANYIQNGLRLVRALSRFRYLLTVAGQMVREVSVLLSRIIQGGPKSGTPAINL